MRSSCRAVCIPVLARLSNSVVLLTRLNSLQLGWATSVHRVEDERSDEEIEAVFDEMVNEHRCDACNRKGTDQRTRKQGTDCDSDEQIPRRSPLPVGQNTASKQEAGAECCQQNNHEEKSGSVNPGPPSISLEPHL